MRDLKRKAVVTAGLGAALVAATAGTASATGNAGLLNPQLPGPGAATEQQGGLGQAFPVGSPTDRLPTGQVTSTLQGATEHTLPAAQQALPPVDVPNLPVLGG